MKYLKPILIVVACAFVAACASVKSFNMPSVEDNLARAFQKSEDISGEMKSDLEQKKALMDTLRKGKSPKFLEVEGQLKTRMSTMETHLAAATKHTKAMSQAKGHITSLGYAKKSITATEPQYAQVEELVKDFESSAGQFTAANEEYTRESNSLAELVTVKKLYFNFDVVEFQNRIQKSMMAAQENSSLMDREIRRAEDIRNTFDNDTGRAPANQSVSQAVEQMSTILKEHSEKVQSLTNLGAEMNRLAQGQSKIPSTTPNWNDVQRVVNDVDRTTVTMNELFKEFQLKVDRVRNAPKGP